MFDIGMTEMLVIAVVAIIVVGPKDLPGMLRNIGRYVSQIRGMAREFQGQMDSALKEAELDGVKDTFNDIRNMNPVNQLKNEVSDYMDSARALDEPDTDANGFKTGTAIDSGVPDKTPQSAPSTPAGSAGKSDPVKPKQPDNDVAATKSGQAVTEARTGTGGTSSKSSLADKKQPARKVAPKKAATAKSSGAKLTTAKRTPTKRTATKSAS